MIAFFKHFWIYLDTAMPLIVFLLAVLQNFRKRIFTKSDKYIIGFLFFQCLLNGISNYLSENDTNNHWIFHLNALASQCLFTLYFYKFFCFTKKRRLPIIGFIVFLCFYFVSILFIQTIDKFNSYTFALGSFIIVNYTLIGFKEIINELPSKKVYSIKEFWLFTALLIYYGSSFFIFISYNYISIIAPTTVGVLWLFNNIFITACCILLYISLISKEWIRK